MDATKPPFLPLRAGTAGGTLLTILLQISSAELIKTIVTAGTGALVSFFVSYALQALIKRRR